MADKIKKFLVDNKGCPLTPAATKQLFTKFLEFLVKEGYGEELESLKNGVLRYGKYLYYSKPDRFEHITSDEDVPEDYNGLVIDVDETGIYVDAYTDGQPTTGTHIGAEGVNRVNPDALVGLTHSFNELDPVLKQIVDDAIDDDDTDGVACSPAQWSAIKLLLDNSLYLNYAGFSLIKSASDGLIIYLFGLIGAGYGSRLELHYSEIDNLLYAKYSEL